ncbi:MAG: hypothetical protein AAF492_22030, partial [Verrucomicrobiota bacterium]
MKTDLYIECLGSAGRAILIAGGALVLARCLIGRMAGLSRKQNIVAWTLLAIPFFSPSLLSGYAYSSFAFSSVGNEVLYAVLLLVKLTPLAALVLAFSPPRMSRDAQYSFRLTGHRRPLSRIGMWLRGPAQIRIAGFALIALLAFGEFELASFFMASSWTVTLFDLQVGGLPISESLGLAATPLIIEIGLLAIVMTILFRMGAQAEPIVHRPDRATPLRLIAFWGYLASALTAALIIPFIQVCAGSLSGLSAFLSDFSLSREIGASLFMAGLTLLVVG